MTIKNLKPRPPIDKFIHHYTIIEYAGEFPEDLAGVVSPSLGTGFFFIYQMEQPIRIRIGQTDQVHKYSPAHLITPTFKSINHYVAGKVGIIRVIFHPGRLHQLLDMPLDRLTGKLIKAEDVLGRELEDLRDQIIEAEDNLHRIDLIETFLMQKIRYQDASLSIVEAANRILEKSDGPIEVKELARQLYVSERKLERHFKRQIGMTPKDFLSVRRFCQALEMLHAPKELMLSSIALKCHYYDQPHFNREFRKLMGVAPTTYLNRIGKPYYGKEDIAYDGVVLSKKKIIQL